MSDDKEKDKDHGDCGKSQGEAADIIKDGPQSEVAFTMQHNRKHRGPFSAASGHKGY